MRGTGRAIYGPGDNIDDGTDADSGNPQEHEAQDKHGRDAPHYRMLFPDFHRLHTPLRALRP
jgi:hypothetical protein